jgi:hypothetical protein
MTMDNYAPTIFGGPLPPGEKPTPNAEMPARTMTKRELFASQAMQSLLTPITGDEDPQLWSYEELAKSAVKSADALLKELAR